MIGEGGAHEAERCYRYTSTHWDLIDKAFVRQFLHKAPDADRNDYGNEHHQIPDYEHGSDILKNPQDEFADFLRTLAKVKEVSDRLYGHVDGPYRLQMFSDLLAFRSQQSMVGVIGRFDGRCHLLHDKTKLRQPTNRQLTPPDFGVRSLAFDAVPESLPAGWTSGRL